MRTVTAVAIHSESENPIFGESVITVSLEDEAGGFFLKLTSNENNEAIRIELEELREVYEAAKWLIEQANKGDK